MLESYILSSNLRRCNGIITAESGLSVSSRSRLGTTHHTARHPPAREGLTSPQTDSLSETLRPSPAAGWTGVKWPAPVCSPDLPPHQTRGPPGPDTSSESHKSSHTSTDRDAANTRAPETHTKTGMIITHDNTA